MKKLLSVLMCGVLVLSLTGCGKDKEVKEEKQKNTKSIVCNMKEVTTSQDEMTMTQKYTFNFVDDNATDFIMVYNMKVKETEENLKQLNETNWEENLKSSFSYMGIDENAMKISTKKIADNELEITLTADFKDFAKSLMSEEELANINNELTYDNIKNTLIKTMEEDEDVTCVLP